MNEQLIPTDNFVERFNALILNTVEAIRDSMIKDCETVKDGIPFKDLKRIAMLRYHDDNLNNIYSVLKDRCSSNIVGLYEHDIEDSKITELSKSVVQDFILATILGRMAKEEISVSSVLDLRAQICNICNGIMDLFKTKNNTYRSNSDPMMNFTQGGMLLFGDDSYNGKFGALKSYVAKHIVTAINNDITFAKLTESTLDIAVYFTIAIVMKMLSSESSVSLGGAQ